MLFPSRCVLAVCLWFATVVAASAQPTARLIVDQWRAEDGLPQDTVTTVAQDDKGYLWIATRKGLARFDGAQFQPMTRVGDVDLGNMRLTSVLPEPDGGLWISTYGQGVLHVVNGEVTRYGADVAGNPWAREYRRTVVPCRLTRPCRDVPSQSRPSRPWKTTFTPSPTRSGGRAGACHRRPSK